MKKTITFKNGDVYEGEVDADRLPHGKGRMDYNLNGYYGEYRGRWEHGKRCGKGHYYQFSKGGGASHRYDYKGEWLDDKEHGQGVSTTSDERGVHLASVSETYTGGFREGKRHGHGVVVKDSFDGYFVNGQDRFEGEFEDGKTIGNGVWEYANGDRFEGGFKANCSKHGHGVYTFKNGLRYEGDWEDGRFIPESYVPDPSMKNPTLIVTEKHSGFDYNKSGCFLLFAEEGMMLYEEAATLWHDYNFDMTDAGIGILAVTADSVTFEVRGEFTKDHTLIEATIHRGETQKYENARRCTVTIYDDDYNYTAADSLEVVCM